MALTRLLVAVAALLAFNGGFTSADEETGSCPLNSWDEVGVPLEHTDEVCDRAYENDPERIERIRAALSRSVATGAARQLKDEQTWYCPEDDFVEDLRENAVGPPSSWIFHNRASSPVVVSWVDPQKKNLEVSAFNSDIYPAHHDPEAIVQPGNWEVVSVFIGHIFHVRELVSVGGGELAPGRILLRHRTGPLPIKNRFGGKDLQCPVQALADPEPEPPSEFERVPFDYQRRCNSLHTAFVNRMNCPVDVYYAGVEGDFVTPSALPTSAKNETVSGNRKNSCQERFSFHLGVNPAAGADYFDKWDSPIAFEATYLTHKFVARLRHDSDVVVDEVVVDRTVIRDCPRKKKTPVAAETADKEGILTGSDVHTPTDVAVEANGETLDIALSNFDASVLASTKNSTAPSTAQNVTKTAAKPGREETDVESEASSTCEASVLSVLTTSVGS